MGSRVVQPPEPPPPTTSPGDGLRAQQAFFDIVRRAGAPGGSTRSEEYRLSQREINGFLAQHLGELAGTPVAGLSVRLSGDGIVEVYARTTVRRLMEEGAGRLVAGAMPAGWLTHTVWIRIRGPLRIETEATRSRRRFLRVQPEHVYLGRQRLPVAILPWLLRGGGPLLRWSVPDAVDTVTVEPELVIIRTASSR